jgi:prepilin-type processing-associated H-X9-DG protein
LKKERKRNFTVVELLLVTVILMVIIGMLMPALALAREKARRTNCVSNMKQIGLSLRSYAIDYVSWFPDPYPASTLSTDSLEPKLAMDKLVENLYLTTGRIYMCPSTEHDTRVDDDSHIVDPSHLYVVDEIGPISEIDAGQQTAIGADRRANHLDPKGGFKYGNILFSDGHVEVFHGATWWRSEKIGKDMQDYIEKFP